jgi:hypothetical protein
MAGCAPFGIDYPTLKTALAVAAGIEKPPGITLEQAAAVPYATIAFRIGSGGETMLVLASDQGGEQLWTSSERLAVTTRSGRITSCGGLQWNLSRSQFPQGDPLQSGLQGATSATPSIRLVDFNDLGRFSLRITARFESVGPESISVLGSDLATTAFVEICTCPEIGWEFKNKFWMDHETGFIWQSQQSIHPNLPQISITVLRPPA